MKHTKHEIEERIATECFACRVEAIEQHLDLVLDGPSPKSRLDDVDERVDDLVVNFGARNADLSARIAALENAQAKPTVPVVKDPFRPLPPPNFSQPPTPIAPAIVDRDIVLNRVAGLAQARVIALEVALRTIEGDLLAEFAGWPPSLFQERLGRVIGSIRNALNP